MCVVFILRARITLRYGRRTRAQMARWPSFVRAPTERSSAFSLSSAACPFALPCLLLLRERRTEEGSVQDLQRQRGQRTAIGAHYRRCGASVAHLSKQADELCYWGACAAALSLHVLPLSTFFFIFLGGKGKKVFEKETEYRGSVRPASRYLHRSARTTHGREESRHQPYSYFVFWLSACAAICL